MIAYKMALLLLLSRNQLILPSITVVFMRAPEDPQQEY
jgi:hypothetical protein